MLDVFWYSFTELFWLGKRNIETSSGEKFVRSNEGLRGLRGWRIECVNMIIIGFEACLKEWLKIRWVYSLCFLTFVMVTMLELRLPATNYIIMQCIWPVIWKTIASGVMYLLGRLGSQVCLVGYLNLDGSVGFVIEEEQNIYHI